jgi:hypothetical protein
MITRKITEEIKVTWSVAFERTLTEEKFHGKRWNLKKTNH